jgi:hypothetical protein
MPRRRIRVIKAWNGFDVRTARAAFGAGDARLRNMNRREQVVQILARGKSCVEILIENLFESFAILARSFTTLIRLRHVDALRSVSLTNLFWSR